MTAFNIRVNGAELQAEAEPRTHLADFLREGLLLTGTHLGCEHGVCGACTVLLDGEPARACITYAADCAGREVCTIEGLEEDDVTASLRVAFSAEHALQCGYCTPGMLVTARDIVLRLPGADDDRVRLELAGSLCRCTGYNGIVRAIRRVLDARQGAKPLVLPPMAMGRFDVLAVAITPALATAVPQSRFDPNSRADPNRIVQVLPFGLSADRLWNAVQDPALIASCVPGAELTDLVGERIAGKLRVALGPIKGSFAGQARVSYDPPARTGRIEGEGRDRASGTRLGATAEFAVLADGEQASVLRLEVTYALRGPLAQFGRGPVIQVFAAEIAAEVGRMLEARLRGAAPPATLSRLRTGGLMLRVFWRSVRRLVLRRDAP